MRRCLQTWLSDATAQRQLYGDLEEAAQQAARRRQAVQILGFPEEFCLEEEPLGMGKTGGWMIDVAMDVGHIITDLKVVIEWEWELLIDGIVFGCFWWDATEWHRLTCGYD